MAEVMIRPEREADHPAIAEVVRAALAEHPDEVASFVERIRASEQFKTGLSSVEASTGRDLPSSERARISFGGSDVNEEGDHTDRSVPSMPLEQGGRRLRMDETEPRALGVPLSWFRLTEPIDVRWVRHPYRWLRWRSEVRRRGPYAPRFEDFRPR